MPRLADWIERRAFPRHPQKKRHPDVEPVMTTWREDALKGAVIGALVFLGVALIIVLAQWL
jgi:hypothetical protein